MTDGLGRTDRRTESLLLVWPRREYRPGDRLTVDSRRAVIRRVRMDTGTVLDAEIEVYDSDRRWRRAGRRSKWMHRLYGLLRFLGVRP